MSMQRELLFAILMMVSAVILTWKWLSLYDRVDAIVIFSAFLLTFSLGMLLLNLEYRIYKMKEELESLKRLIAVNVDDLESRVEGKLRAYMESLEEKMEGIERRLYR